MELGLASLFLLIGLGLDTELEHLSWSYPDTHKRKYTAMVVIKYMCLIIALILFVKAWLF